MNLFQELFYALLLKTATATVRLGQVKSLLRVGTLIFLIVTATACGGETSTPSDAVTPEAAIQLNNPFVVHVGQSATLEDEPVKLTFDSVLQDIRCPSKVQCAEEGFAQIQVGVQVADQESAAYKMNTEPFYKAEIGLGVNKIAHEGYEIQLAELNPAPEYPDDKLDFGTYEATFVVTKK